jgi:heterodisulfide reductase subunit A
VAKPKQTVVGAVLVVGGGISGMQAALDLAESGFKVYLVDKSSSIGGVMAQLDKTFPTNDCAMCIMAPKLVATGRHHNIELITNAEVEKVTGDAGNFQVTVNKHFRRINEEKCTGCGECAGECPIEVVDEFNENLIPRAAVHIKYPQAVPLVYAIDPDHCIGCGICEKTCKAQAIEYFQEPEKVELNVGSVILSPGFDEFVPTAIQEYGYGKLPNVLTSIEFERVLSATGPSTGLVLRPSDGDIPEKVAFIQCVGSRCSADDVAGNEYCSSVCCMYAIKEAIIAQEHTDGLHSTIFFMDMRAFGKEFDDYYKRAQDEYGIRFIRSRVAEVGQDPETRNPIVRYIDDEENVVDEQFDLVVLSVGLNSPENAGELSEVFGIDLNKYNFCDTGTFTPLDTSRPGIFVGGAFAAPKDIPDTVAQASGAAARAAGVVASERGNLIVTKEYPEEKDTKWDRPRIGVFVCHCGINIGGVVDVPAVVEYAAKLPGVVYAERNLYTCSQDTQEQIKDMIEEHHLNRVIVASCTPRTHEPLFQNTVREAGINPYLFEMTNIRDQCSWVHMHEPAEATEKAKDLVRMVVAKAYLLEPLKRMPLEVNKSALVVGGGLSGMTAALEIADQGYMVHLVERAHDLGGNLRNVKFILDPKSQDHFLDTQDKLDEIIERIQKNDKIILHTNSEIKSIGGFVGNFVSVVEDNGEEDEIKHGAIVIATGANELAPDEYLYGKDERVVTQLELEEMLAGEQGAGSGEQGAGSGEQTRPAPSFGDSEGTPKAEVIYEVNYRKKQFVNSRSQLPVPKLNNVVMIQCVGSRNQERPYCSRVCCTNAIKNALKLKELNPNVNIYILYRDIRTYGFREEFYRRSSEAGGVFFIRYEEDQPPELVKKGKKLQLTLTDPVLEDKLTLDPDLVVLSTAIIPNEDSEELAKMLKVPMSKDKFFLEAHMKLRPVDFATDGVFLCGLAHSPKFIDEAISQAEGAAARACIVLSQDVIEAEGTVATVNEAMCRGCGMCIEVCPFNAIEFQEFNWFGHKLEVASVNEVLCKGCGSCTASCLSGAIQQKKFDDKQLLSMVESFLAEDEDEPDQEVEA